LILDVLQETVPGAAYGVRLLAVLDQGADGNSANDTLLIVPALVCVACGGSVRQVLPVCGAWRLLHAAAKLLDDVEDGDTRGGWAEVINLAIGMVFVGQFLTHRLARSGLDPLRVLRASQAYSQAGLAACSGQHDDLLADDPDPDRWLAIATAKSGALLGWAAWAGALAAGAQEHVLAAYRQYGTRLGVLLQVADDYNGVWHPDAASDLATGRPTLAVAYALSVGGADEQRQLRAQLAGARAGDSGAAEQARALLAGLGAPAFLLAVARLQQRQALDSLQLAAADEQHGQPLRQVLRQVFPALSKLEG
jgi:geranylgeranyl diphosphate synthase, type I